jgi:glycosyltransferase involved in cell wall biosynthesis
VEDVIAFITGRDPQSEVSGGHSSYARAHARAAARAGYIPHIFCAGRVSDVRETDFGIIHRIASPLRPFRQLMVMGHARIIAAEVTRFFMATTGTHLIHSFGAWGYAGVIAAERLRSNGRRAVAVLNSYTTYHDELHAKIKSLAPSHGSVARIRYNAEHLWARWLVERCEREAYLQSRLVIVNYESVTRLIRARHGPGVRIVKLPYTCESAFLREPPSLQGGGRLYEAPASVVAADNSLSIVTVARHEPNKGIHILLAALAELRRAGIKFTACMVGAGPLLESHRRLADKLQLKDVVTMVGAVADVSPYLLSANVFVLPSLAEGSGSLALIEAMQAGLPIVASGVDGILEDLTDGENALLVRPGSFLELSSAIGRLAIESSLGRRLGTAARQRFVERFSAEAFSRSLGDLYSTLRREAVDDITAISGGATGLAQQSRT